MFILAVVGIVIAFSVTLHAETQYTWEIPIKLTVKEGGSAAASALDFEIELHDLSGAKIDLGGHGGEFLNPSPYVQTSGIGTYTVNLRFQGGEELYYHLIDGFILILKDSGEDGWVYDEREYEVAVKFDDATREMTEISIKDCDSGESTDAAAFECTYTGWYLHFETTGGSYIGAVSASHGSTIYLSGYTTTRDCYTFNGWYEDDALQRPAETVTLNQETWVYAGWLENGHSYEAVVTEPTCTTGGYTTYTCSVCGDSYTADETDATGHSYGSPSFTWSEDYSTCTAT
ncbi:MAG: hypothetical protein LUH43_05665, partial [Clostridia bacterium]|nr:hypothetical protein [Clostridia bacterium]